MLSAAKIKAISYIVELRLTTDGQFDQHPHLLNVQRGRVCAPVCWDPTTPG